MESKSCFELAVVGAGVVGAALAAALGRALPGSPIAFIGPGPAPADGRIGPFDARVYALSPGNAAFLDRLGAWARIPPERRAPVHAMRVYGDSGASLLEFDAYRAGVGELAWIVEDSVLLEALLGACRAQERITAVRGSLAGIEIRGKQALLGLEGGDRLEVQLVVGADGARSRVREAAGIAASQVAYAQSAVVANFACSRTHRNIAWQWFQGAVRGGAVLALLPLPGGHVSMVWSVGAEEAARLAALAPEALAGEVAAASGGALGELSLVTPPRVLPLARLAAAKLVAPRIALAGDAAHVIHPLAGQGANLGLQDARVLAEVLAAREPGRDPGDERLLRRYERARAEDILAMRAAVHGLFRLFAAQGGLASRLRNAGLNLVDRLPVLKNALMRHAMG